MAGVAASALHERVARRAMSPSWRALLGTALGNAPGFLLPFAAARHFGIGRTTDAYAFALAVTVFGLAVVSGVVEANVLPAAQIAKLSGSREFRTFLRTKAQQAALLSFIYVPVALLASIFLLARPGWTTEQRQAGVVMIVVLLGVVVLAAYNSVQSAGLYSLGAFLTPTASQCCRATLPLVALPFLGKGPTAMVIVASLMVAGEGIRSFLLSSALRRRVDGLSGRGGPTPPPVWRVAAPHALNMVVLSANPLIDRMVAASLVAGSVTTLDLGERVYYVPVLIVTSSVVLVAGARWSQETLRPPAQLRDDFRRTLGRIVLVSISLAALVSGAVLASHALGLDTFAGAHADEFVKVTIVLLAALPFATAASLCGRFLTATRRTRILPIFAVVIVAANTACDVIGAHLSGLVGIAGGTVVAQAIAALCFLSYCARIFRTSATSLEHGGGQTKPSTTSSVSFE